MDLRKRTSQIQTVSSWKDSQKENRLDKTLIQIEARKTIQAAMKKVLKMKIVHTRKAFIKKMNKL